MKVKTPNDQKPMEKKLNNYPPELKFAFRSLEKIPITIWENDQVGCEDIAHAIAIAIQQKQREGKQLVLGLATGSSPIKIYQELIRMHRKEGLDFSNVVTFNLDEYYPMEGTESQSYVRFMNEYLFDHVNIPKDQIHIPDGTVPLDDIKQYCDQYEKKIQLHGGLDIQLLGIGRTGHIAFNEPGSRVDSSTRLVKLDNLTRRDAIKDFGEIEYVPYRALTMGIKTILQAKQIFIFAWGQHKAKIVREAAEGPINAHVPATYLQEHPNVNFYLDKSAAERLTRVETPWLIGSCDWTEDLICKAVVWLSNKLNKPILKLTDEDYNEHDLSELILENEDGYSINLRIFNRLQHTITGWPGGKPNADDSTRPERSKPKHKRIILFSPHPDDDVISMGGTFLRLVQQGHDVHVAYQTSGDIAVHPYDTQRYLEFFKEYGSMLDLNIDHKSLDEARKHLTRKKAEVTPKSVRKINALIRRGEARSGARYTGLKDKNIHFLDLPFYETGQGRKMPLSQKDIDITIEIMQEIKPHMIFAAGDLADPHGTHRVCLDAVLASFEQLRPKEDWIKDCWLWLYRGAWHEYNIDEIEMAIPISPEELLRKRKAIFMHQSQKDRPPFPGEDDREFWVRAEDRNRATAQAYRALGFAEYEAMEAFKRWKF